MANSSTGDLIRHLEKNMTTIQPVLYKYTSTKEYHDAFPDEAVMLLGIAPKQTNPFVDMII